MRDLKPCPFCGHLPRTEIQVAEKYHLDDHVDFCIHCPECGTTKTVRLNIQVYCDFSDVVKKMDEVVEVWNRRAGDSE